MIKPHHAIPADEVWVKVGGDHGGGSFKMSFQVTSVDNPNSERNTVVFCLYEANDSHPNVKSVLARYKEQIKLLQIKRWR